jgi:hypothetical protein
MIETISLWQGCRILPAYPYDASLRAWPRAEVGVLETRKIVVLDEPDNADIRALSVLRDGHGSVDGETGVAILFVEYKNKDLREYEDQKQPGYWHSRRKNPFIRERQAGFRPSTLCG